MTVNEKLVLILNLSSSVSSNYLFYSDGVKNSAYSKKSGVNGGIFVMAKSPSCERHFQIIGIAVLMKYYKHRRGPLSIQTDSNPVILHFVKTQKSPPFKNSSKVPAALSKIGLKS